MSLFLFLLAILASAAPALTAQARTYHIKSKILGEDRVIHVSLPPNYSVAKQRYEVVYVLDGHVRAFFDMAVASAGYDISTGGPHEYAMPPQIVVGVEQKQRGVDLGSNQETFDRFLAEELVPYIDKEFRTVPYRTLVGHSLGGRFALFTICRNPGMFASVIAMSPGLGNDASLQAMKDCLRRDFGANRTVVRQLALTAGDRESGLFPSAMKLRDFVRDSAPPNWRMLLVDGTGLGHTDTPFAGIPPGIKFTQAAAVWEMPAAQGDSVISATGDEAERRVAGFYKALSARMGFAVAPSAKWLHTIASRYLAQRDYAKGMAAAKRMTDAYPEDISGWGVLTDACKLEGDTDCAKRSLEDALRMVDRMDYFDENGRAIEEKLIRDNLAKLRPPE